MIEVSVFTPLDVYLHNLREYLLISLTQLLCLLLTVTTLHATFSKMRKLRRTAIIKAESACTFGVILGTLGRQVGDLGV